MTFRLGVRAALVEGVIVPGDVTVDPDEGRVAAIGVEPAGSSGLATPGFVELQVNGIAGIDFTDADVDGYRIAGQALAATGVTSYQPTLISLPEEAYLGALARLALAQEAVGSGPRLLGAHLEGPFLSPMQAGAHRPEVMRDPDPELADRLCDTGPVSYVTVAPELSGALDLISHLTKRGVVVAIGHSDADAATAHEAFDRGARAVTHLFNAQRPFHHRDPGLGVAGLVHPGVILTLIVDGIHLAGDTVMLALSAAPGRCALITDAISAAGQGDGSYSLGNQTVSVTGAEARLGDGTLAGSVLTMDQAVRNLIELGVDPVQALGAATTVPAGLAASPELASLVPGSPADVTVLDDEYRVVRTMVAGQEVYSA